MATNCGQYKSELDLLHEIADSLSGGGSSGGKDFELQVVKDANGDLFLFRPKLDESTDTYTFDYIDANGSIAYPVGALELIGQSYVQGNRTVSPPSTGVINIPINAKSISVAIVGDGATIDGVSRPDGFVRTFEISNVLQQSMVVNGNGTATIYVDYTL